MDSITVGVVILLVLVVRIDGNLIFSVQPFAQVDELAALAAERIPCRKFRSFRWLGDGFSAGRAFHDDQCMGAITILLS